MKKCSKCGQEKESTEYFVDSSKRDGLQPSCKKCRGTRASVLYTERYSTQVKSKTSIRRISSNIRVSEYKESCGCLICNESDPVCLDFHHLDPAEKEFDISTYLSCGWAKIHDEMLKCVVLCANCHRKVHAGKITLLPD